MENGESSPGVSPCPSVAPLNPEVILTEVNSESEAFNATLQPIKVCNQSPISILYRVTHQVGKCVGLTLIWNVPPSCLGSR